MKRVVSLNVNGLRSAITKGLKDWIATNDFDVLCFQETKMDVSHADPDYFKDLGYTCYWHCAEKKGYSGVMTMTKTEPLNISYGTGLSVYDREGRMLLIDFPEYSIANCYFPSGSASEERHEFKMQFLKDMLPIFTNLLNQKQKLILVGDYNIVHKDLDIHNPTRKDNPSGFRPEERAWLDSWFNELFHDSFRLVYPDKKEFSWWSYRAGSFMKDKGWRIDYHSVSRPLQSAVKDFKHHRDLRFSDHCALEGSYEL